jgi:hypothetical protein
MMKNIIKILLIPVVLIIASCSDYDLDKGLENPNEVSVGALDVNLLMNKILLDFSDFFAEATAPTMQLTRMNAMTGGLTYERAFSPQSFNQPWLVAYQRVLIQINTLLSKTEGTKLTAHSGVAKILQAFTNITLVDLFGDVPYSEALKGADGNFNPKVDGGKSIYDASLKLLDDGIALLAQTPSSGITRDVYYGGNAAKWTALANTIKLKAYLNLRLTDAATAKTKINELLKVNLIDTDDEEFTYNYSTADVPLRSRHPLYQQYYTPTEGSASGYINNSFMQTVYKGRGVEDPRWRYYFFRQIGSIDQALDDEPESIPCLTTPRPAHYDRNTAWCAFEPGFFGREHGNGDGTPPDSRAVTCWGVYPCGGRVDLNNGVATFQSLTKKGQGANGAGIEPIWLASFTEFVKAEAAVTLGTDGDAKAFLMSGVKKSIDRVRAFATAKGQTLTAGLEPSQAAYQTAVETLYTAATTADARMSVIGKEYHTALFGNGVEAYNLYRRTGKPIDLQLMRAANGGKFLRSLLYPADFINLNSSTKQKVDGSVKVFWDNNPDNFIK